MANYKRGHRKRVLGKENQEPTRAFVIEMDEAPKLTVRQEAFVMALLSGKTKAEAYREAGYSQDTSDKIITIKACELAKKPNVQAAIRLGQKAALDRRPVTLEGHLADLARLRELAVDSAQIAAGVQAETVRGKVAGLHEERLRVTIGLSDEALLSQLANVLSPEIANDLAKSLLPKREMVTLEAEAIEILERVSETNVTE